MQSRCTRGTLQIQRHCRKPPLRKLWVLYVAELPRTAAVLVRALASSAISADECFSRRRAEVGDTLGPRIPIYVFWLFIYLFEVRSLSILKGGMVFSLLVDGDAVPAGRREVGTYSLSGIVSSL